MVNMRNTEGKELAMNILNAENVYETLIGAYEEAYGIPGVDNALAEGSECDRLYRQVYDANRRLCERLGQAEEDPDVELIISNLLAMTKLLCLEMYHYGGHFSGKN